MEEKTKLLKLLIKIVGFSVLGCSIVATLLASSKYNKKKNNILLFPNQIHKGKRASKKITARKRVTVTPSNNNIKQAVGIHFPMEIILEILSRLPVRSLLRFKCASKSWKALISEPYFKTKHWNRAKNNQNFLISRLCPKADTMSYFSSSLSSVQPVEDVQKLGFPANGNSGGYIIQCCCDGLSLLWLHGDHLLWNPSTNESVVLPNPEFPPHFSCTYGMGYDSTSDDYKILKIDNMGHGPKAYGKILALKTGSWRKTNKHPRASRNYMSGMVPLAFVHGAFHWISMDILHKHFIVSFNISNEVYGEIPLPEGLCNLPILGYLRQDVSVVGGLLCAHCTYRNKDGGTFKLWVMKDYGIKESWTELLTIQETNLYLVIPKYRFSDGEVLLYYDGNGYYWFRTSKGPFQSLPAPCIFHQGFIYKESLISPKLLTYIE